MRLSEAMAYYKKNPVASELVRLAQDREVGVSYGLNKFGRRPDTLQMPGDVMLVVKKGATSFHVSEERWQDPMRIIPDMTHHELESLRIGWDLILDIDFPNFEVSKTVTDLLVRAIRYHNIKSVSVKFSGNKGFHIGVPWEAFPKKVRDRETVRMYPELPQKIAQYLIEFIKPQLSREILRLCNNDLKVLSELLNVDRKDLIDTETREFNPNVLSQLDIGLMIVRHLFRAAYSLNEKSGLVSVAINPDEVMSFSKELATPENIKSINNSFLNAENVIADEAEQLIVQALDWHKREDEREEGEKRTISFEGKVPKEAFPPCIKCILAGLGDGRKRGLFPLINFMRSVNYNWDEIEDEIVRWNKKNTLPLKMGYLKAQLSWHSRQTEKVPPPNCRRYYEEILICKPDSTCANIKNPLNYVWRKLKRSK